MQQHQDLTFTTLKLSLLVEVQGDGIRATDDIEPWQLLMSVNKKDVLCCSNIPEEFRSLM
jgi:hypothetical protein